MKIESVEAFKSFVEFTRNTEGYKDPIGFGIARVDRGQMDDTKILQATFPLLNWKENYGSAAVFCEALKVAGVTPSFDDSEASYEITEEFVAAALSFFDPYIEESKGEAHKNIQVVMMLQNLIDEQSFEEGIFKVVFLYDDVAPKSVEAVYVKLYALSLGKAPLRSLNLTGAFGLLTNCAWIGGEPVELDYLRSVEIELKLRGEYPVIDFIDKFPRFLQHVIPANNTRVLDTSKVRMGAQLAAGTTVMPGASYINFNAGTTGAVMVEGRISSSAVVAEGADVGGGASILGVLSGTNGNPVSIGKNTLLGANSVTGIPLGDGCIVDAGIAVLEGTKFVVKPTEWEKIMAVNPNATVTTAEKEGMVIVKGLDAAALHGIHFRQDSTTGQMVAARSKREIKLNADLH
jgi:2,3,4,5-tetrahydropyridine-2-carboxylate N-succinyltransferase